MKLRLLNSSLIFISVITLVCSPVFAGNKSKRTSIAQMGDTPIQGAVRAEIFGRQEGIVCIFPGATQTYRSFGYAVARKFRAPVINFYDAQDQVIRQELIPQNPALSKKDVAELLKKRLTVLPEVAIIEVETVKAPGNLTVVLLDKNNRQIAHVHRPDVLTANRTVRLNDQGSNVEEFLQECNRLFPILRPNDRLPTLAIENLSPFVRNPNALKTLRVSKVTEMLNFSVLSAIKDLIFGSKF
jgi:hypothetical protein